MEIITKNEEETQKVAKDYAKSLNFGDVIALEGDLGSGKTAFTKGIAEALGVSDVITSPTFVVVKEYIINNFQFSISNFQLNSKSQILNSKKLQLTTNNLQPKLIHVDCYRISEDDAEAVGLNEYLASKENITVIEWPENIKSILPEKTKLVKFKNLGVSTRSINIF